MSIKRAKLCLACVLLEKCFLQLGLHFVSTLGIVFPGKGGLLLQDKRDMRSGKMRESKFVFARVSRDGVPEDRCPWGVIVATDDEVYASLAGARAAERRGEDCVIGFVWSPIRGLRVAAMNQDLIGKNVVSAGLVEVETGASLVEVVVYSSMLACLFPNRTVEECFNAQVQEMISGERSVRFGLVELGQVVLGVERNGGEA